MAGLGTEPVSAKATTPQTYLPDGEHASIPVPSLAAVNPVSKVVPVTADVPRVQSEQKLDDTSFPALPRPSAIKVTQRTDKKREGAATPSVDIGSLKLGKGERKSTTVEKEDVAPLPLLESPHSSQLSKASKTNRQHPGKLDISAATTESASHAVIKTEEASLKPSTPISTLKEQSSTPSSTSRPSTPILPADTPVKRVAAPKTLRITSTPKSETTPPPSAISSSSATQHSTSKPSPATSHQTSRRPSIASVSIADTTTSERIPDDISIATGTISRTSSPPPANRIGSAPVRSKTKSQTKKDRQERTKMLAEEQSVAGSVSSEHAERVKQEPVMGRKKKTKAKKAPTVPTTVSNSPEPSRAHSPEPAPIKARVEQLVAPQNHAEVLKPVEEPKPIPQEVEEKGPRMNTPIQPSEPSRDLLNPAAIVAELESLDPTDLARITDLFLKSAIQTGSKTEHLTADDIWSMATPKTLTSAEIAALNRGEPVRREGIGGNASSRLMISPSKKCLPRLTKELEDRYLELEQRIQASKPPAKYTHHRKEATQILATIDDMLRDMTAILTRPPKSNTGGLKQSLPGSQKNSRRRSSNATDNARPTIQPPASPSYASDALAYLNQFILPPLPNTSRQGAGAGNKYGNSAATTAQSTPLAPAISGHSPVQPLAPLGQPLPNTYTTGDPTYSVNGVDVSTLAQSAASAAAAAVGGLNPADFGLDLAALNQLSQGIGNVAAGNPDLGMGITQASLNAAMKGLGGLASGGGVGANAGNGGSSSSGHSNVNVNVNTETIRQALANAVNGVVQAAAAVAGLPHNANVSGDSASGVAGLQSPNLGIGGSSMSPSAGTAGQQALRGMVGLPPAKTVSIEEAEQALFTARKETEALEKRMAGLVRRNRKMAGLA